MFSRILAAAGLATALFGQNTPPVRAPVRDMLDNYHGTKVSDPYRWMENMNGAEFKSWLKSQGDFARSALDRVPGRERLAAELDKVSGAVASIAQPTRRGSRYFYLKRLPNEDVRKLYTRDELKGAEQLLENPSKRATADVHYSIDYYEPSPDGKYVIYGESPGGSENSVLRIMETATRRDLGEAIDRTQYASPQWRPDGESFFYWREQKRASGAPAATRYLNSQAYLHALGRSPDRDPAVLGRGLNTAVEIAESDFPAVSFTFGSKYAIGLIIHGVQNELTTYIAPIDSVTGPSTPWRKLTDVADAVTSIDVFGDYIYLLTHRDASRFRIVRTSVAKPDLAHVETVVPQLAELIVNMGLAEDGIYVQTLDGGIGRLFRMAHRRGASLEQVALPFDGAISSLWTHDRQAGALFILASWTRPPLLYEYDPAQKKVSDTGLQPPNSVDMSGYEAVEVKARSHDGTLVPLSIIYPKNLTRDGSHPALLEGYGAYGVTSDPYFLAMKRPWLERNGVYAVAHVRGGGEYGEDWHSAGKMQTKPNTFLDGIACAQYLIENGYTSPKKLAVTGTSAGGIFAGGAITERPDLFGAALIRVGVSDALRMETTEGGPANILEFGTVQTLGTQGVAGDESIPPSERRSCVPRGAADDRIQRSAGDTVGACRRQLLECLIFARGKFLLR